MNYNKLRYFYTAAQTLNLTKAADELYVSQSAISRHMKELEEDFGVDLFIRTNRDLILTEAGQVLFDEIRPFFSKEKELYQKVRAAALGTVQHLNIGFMSIQPTYHIPAIVNEMVLEHPNLSVTLRRYNWDEILSALNCSEIDIGLRLRMGSFDDNRYEHFVLDTEAPAMVVSARHPLAAKKCASLREFSRDNFLMLSKKDSALPHTYTTNLFRKSGFTPKVISEYDQVETILMMIHSDAGVSLLSRFAATDQFSDLHIIDLEGMDPLYLELVWKRNSSNPYMEDFIQKLNVDYQNTHCDHSQQHA